MSSCTCLASTARSVPGSGAGCSAGAASGIAITSVSPDDPKNSSLVRAGYIMPEESEEISRKGSVGHHCSGHFDVRGAVVASSLNDRIVGITVEDLKRIPNVILAACGAVKAEAILGALRSGLFHYLATDEAAALKVLAELKKTSTND